jgi:23S rRNA (guanosine2251-2'-O)-methyltransferase
VSRSGEKEYLYGRNAVLEALRAGRGIRRLLVAESAHGSAVQELLAEAQRLRVPVTSLDRHRMDRVAGDRHHQGVLAEVAPFPYRRVEDLLAEAQQRGETPLILALDSLQDPQNFGTLLRTALATGAHGALIPEHRAAGVTPAVSKASAGAVEHLPVARATNLSRALELLKRDGIWVYGLAVEGAQPFWEVDWTGPSALVVGAEGPGLGRLVQSTCDLLVRVPMAPGTIQSLNAATAGSLVLYEAFRQRSTAGKQAADIS